jgi:hypothetical protein
MRRTRAERHNLVCAIGNDPEAERIQLLDQRICGVDAVLQLHRRQWIGGSGNSPDVGWFAYAPLTERAYLTIDYWSLALIASGIGSIGTAINILATVFCVRCKGMMLFRMPLLPWLYATVSGMVRWRSGR